MPFGRRRPAALAQQQNAVLRDFGAGADTNVDMTVSVLAQVRVAKQRNPQSADVCIEYLCAGRADDEDNPVVTHEGLGLPGTYSSTPGGIVIPYTNPPEEESKSRMLVPGDQIWVRGYKYSGITAPTKGSQVCIRIGCRYARYGKDTGEKKTVVTNELGNPVYMPKLDANNQPVVDEDGNPVYLKVLDDNGQPKLDDNGDPIYVVKTVPELDADGKPVPEHRKGDYFINKNGQYRLEEYFTEFVELRGNVPKFAIKKELGSSLGMDSFELGTNIKLVDDLVAQEFDLQDQLTGFACASGSFVHSDKLVTTWKDEDGIEHPAMKIPWVIERVVINHGIEGWEKRTQAVIIMSSMGFMDFDPEHWQRYGELILTSFRGTAELQKIDKKALKAIVMNNMKSIDFVPPVALVAMEKGGADVSKHQSQLDQIPPEFKQELLDTLTNKQVELFTRTADVPFSYEAETYRAFCDPDTATIFHDIGTPLSSVQFNHVCEKLKYRKPIKARAVLPDEQKRASVIVNYVPTVDRFPYANPRAYTTFAVNPDGSPVDVDAILALDSIDILVVAVRTAHIDPKELKNVPSAVGKKSKRDSGAETKPKTKRRKKN